MVACGNIFTCTVVDQPYIIEGGKTISAVGAGMFEVIVNFFRTDGSRILKQRKAGEGLQTCVAAQGICDLQNFPLPVVERRVRRR